MAYISKKQYNTYKAISAVICIIIFAVMGLAIINKANNDNEDTDSETFTSVTTVTETKENVTLMPEQALETTTSFNDSEFYVGEDAVCNDVIDFYVDDDGGAYEEFD